jgi:hypothetical protein
MDNYQKITKTHKILNLSMWTAILSAFLFITYFCVEIPSCSGKSASILSKLQTVNKYYYQLDNGTSVWSTTSYNIGDSVCL